MLREQRAAPRGGLPRQQPQQAPVATPPRAAAAPVAASSRARTVAHGMADGGDSGVNVFNPGEWPDPEFIAETLPKFPQEGIASVFEARVLLEEGYTWLDVRTDLEFDEGHVPYSVNIPIIVGSRRFDPESGERKFKNQKANPDFIKDVEKKFPDKAAKILIGCSDSRKRSIMALEALDEAGYQNIVGVKGGWLFWATIYDQKFRRRRGDGFIEDYSADGDAAGIHGSGAGRGGWEAAGGFSVEKQPLRDYQDWIEYAER